MSVLRSIKSSMLVVVAVLSFMLCCLGIPYKHEMEAKGVLLLDSITFPKIIPCDNYDVVILICNKAQIGDYGTDSIRSDYFNFAKKANLQGESDSVIFAQLIVNGADNRPLAERMGVEPDFLHPLMVVYPAGSSDAIPYPSTEPFTIRALSRFVSRHTKLYYQLPGTLRVFDDLARSFMQESNVASRAQFLKQAEESLDQIEGEHETEVATYYTKLMHKVLEKGDNHIDNELKRLKRLLDDASKMNASKRRTLERHVNVLHHFEAFADKSTSAEEEEL